MPVFDDDFLDKYDIKQTGMKGCFLPVIYGLAMLVAIIVILAFIASAFDS